MAIPVPLPNVKGSAEIGTILPFPIWTPERVVTPEGHVWLCTGQLDTDIASYPNAPIGRKLDPATYGAPQTLSLSFQPKAAVIDPVNNIVIVIRGNSFSDGAVAWYDLDLTNGNQQLLPESEPPRDATWYDGQVYIATDGGLVQRIIVDPVNNTVTKNGLFDLTSQIVNTIDGIAYDEDNDQFIVYTPSGLYYFTTSFVKTGEVSGQFSLGNVDGLAVVDGLLYFGDTGMFEYDVFFQGTDNPNNVIQLPFQLKTGNVTGFTSMHYDKTLNKLIRVGGTSNYIETSFKIGVGDPYGKTFGGNVYHACQYMRIL